MKVCTVYPNFFKLLLKYLLLCWFVFDTHPCFNLVPLSDLKQEAKELKMCYNDATLFNYL